jgi:regulator of protease activity HflC (stomatin/prohibitin superfamily)
MSNENKKLVLSPENPNGILVDMTAEEITQSEIDAQNAIAEKEAEETAKQAKKTAQATGNQKLLDLGLTQAEATALTGYTPPSEV